MKRLIGAVILDAVKALDRESTRSEAMEFFDSDSFITFAVSLELNADSIRQQVKAGTYQRMKIRAAYR